MNRFATQSVHSGSHDDGFGAVMPPIYATSTFAQRARANTEASNMRAAATRPARR